MNTPLRASIEQFVIEGLGHQSYSLTDPHSGTMAIIDPRRDIDVYLQAASQEQTRITQILETHLHNDYISGARELAAQTGATIVASALDPLRYAYHPVREDDQVAVGELSLRVLHTPGHTPEHVSYLLSEPDQPAPTALFSGGSLLVANAGRTDLLGPTMTLTLTRQQYQTLRRLLEALPGQVRVYPTHGAGSFCQASASDAARTTTIAQERLVNPAALAHSEEAFVQRQIAGYAEYPAYYRFMGPANREGPAVLGRVPTPALLSPRKVSSRLRDGVALVDGRDREVFAHQHVPGSLNIELNDTFGTYVGWTLPFNVPLILLIENEAGRREAVVQLIRIGYERIEGFVDGGIHAWQAAALPTSELTTMELVTCYQHWSRRESGIILDVRRSDEWHAGHIPGALHMPLGDLATHLQDLPQDQPLFTLCQTGYRAEIAASLIAATGRDVIAVRDGMGLWSKLGWPTTRETEEAKEMHQHPQKHGHA